jgi:outer membrane immunogenic protein
MRKLLIAGVGVLSSVILVGPAIAADLKAPKRERPQQQRQQQQQASNWNGGQAGGSNGASSVNNNFVEPGAYNIFDGCVSLVDCPETPFSFSGAKTSYIIGAFLGYRQQMGNMVVGVEGDINWKKGETSKVQITYPAWLDSCCGETFTGSLKQGADGSLRVRGGVLVTPDTLLYVTGGLAVGQVSGSFSYYAVGSSYTVSGAASWNDTRVGGTVGAGAESVIARGVKGRIEYRYTDFGKFSKDVPLYNDSAGVCGPSHCGTNAHIDLRAFNHRIMVGIGIDFNGM